jgi:hypothetical protein
VKPEGTAPAISMVVKRVRMELYITTISADLVVELLATQRREK